MNIYHSEGVVNNNIYCKSLIAYLEYAGESGHLTSCLFHKNLHHALPTRISRYLKCLQLKGKEKCHTGLVTDTIDFICVIYKINADTMMCYSVIQVISYSCCIK